MNRRNARLRERYAAGQDVPQHDDVKCYRCGQRRHRPDTTSTTIDTAIGTLTVQVCDPSCDEEDR